LVRIEDPLPEGVHARAVALVESDGKGGNVGRDVRGQHRPKPIEQISDLRYRSPDGFLNDP
jgi:hypothetical protein